MSEVTNKEKRNYLPLAAGSVGLTVGLCMGLVIFTGYQTRFQNTPINEAVSYLTVNAYYAGCLQAESLRQGGTIGKKIKSRCQQMTEYYSAETNRNTK